MRQTYDDYTLDDAKKGKPLVLNMGEYDEGAYNRLRQRLSTYRKRTKKNLISKKDGDIVTIYRV